MHSWWFGKTLAQTGNYLHTVGLFGKKIEKKKEHKVRKVQTEFLTIPQFLGIIWHTHTGCIYLRVHNIGWPAVMKLFSWRLLWIKCFHCFQFFRRQLPTLQMAIVVHDVLKFCADPTQSFSKSGNVILYANRARYTALKNVCGLLLEPHTFQATCFSSNNIFVVSCVDFTLSKGPFLDTLLSIGILSRNQTTAFWIHDVFVVHLFGLTHYFMRFGENY